MEIPAAINPGDEVPIYRQIVRHIIEAIAGGRLNADDPLESHRELSARLKIAPLTVKKAYDELEGQGFIETRRGLGTFVSARTPQFSAAERRDVIRQACRKLLADAYLAGLRLRDVAEILKEADGDLTNGPQGGK